MKLYIIVSLISLKFVLVNSARILAVFPTPSISHQIVFRPLVHQLVNRGHAVTVITTDPVYPKGQGLSNLTEINVHDLSYKLWRENLIKGKVGKQDDVFSQVQRIMTVILKIFEAQLAVSDVQDIIYKKKEEYDLILLEAYVKPILIFSHIYKDVPVIQISSLAGLPYNYEAVGAATHPILYPTTLHQRLYNLTAWEKIYNLYKYWRFQSMYDEHEKSSNLVLQNIFGPDVPSIREMSDNIDMIFLNCHSMWTNNQPVPPSVVYIGRINNRPPQQLSEDLQTFLDSSQNGVIYFSLGTNVIPSLLPPSKIQMITKVFSELPYDVIWKWDKDALPGQTDNIKTYKWLPQSDLLKHPNIKLFITQGGLQSTEEAIQAEVPLIGIPLLTDQWYNTEKFVYHKIGIKLDLPSLNKNLFKEAIETVITDKSYKENIKKLRNIFEDEPQSPLDRAVWWTEYVLRHGGAKHLRAAGANITWTQYLELELLALVGSVVFSVLILIFCTLKFISRKYIYNYYETEENKVKVS